MTEDTPRMSETEIVPSDPATAVEVHAMTPETKALLRRRFLTGGAAAVPMIVTFGRRGMAQTAVGSLLDCFSKGLTPLMKPGPNNYTFAGIVEEATGLPQVPLNDGDVVASEAEINKLIDLTTSAGGVVDTTVFPHVATQATIEGQACFGSHGIIVAG